MKTFVHHNGGLGDLLLSLPCLQRLKAGSGPVHLAGRADAARLLKDAGVVDAAVSIDEAIFASLYSTIDSRLREFLSRFDQAFVFTTENNQTAAAAIRSVIPLTRIIRTIPLDRSRMHIAQYRFSQLERGALLAPACEFPNMPQDRRKEARSLLLESGGNRDTAVIAVHPGSGGKAKCWPFERYVELIDRILSDRNAFVVLFTGDAEENELRRAVARFARNRRNTLHAADLDLMSAAALLSLCGLYLGNDSGFSHLAGILGCTTIVLFGPTDPLRWKPLGPRVHVVSSGGIAPMARITVDDVMAKARSVVPSLSRTDAP